MLGSMLCCRCLKILDTFWTRGFVFSFCTAPCRLYSWSCSYLFSQSCQKGLQGVRSVRCHQGLVHGRCSGKAAMVIMIFVLLWWLICFLAPGCYVRCKLGDRVKSETQLKQPRVSLRSFTHAAAELSQSSQSWPFVHTDQWLSFLLCGTADVDVDALSL